MKTLAFNLFFIYANEFEIGKFSHKEESKDRRYFVFIIFVNVYAFHPKTTQFSDSTKQRDFL